jgi:hypothetical protein
LKYKILKSIAHNFSHSFVSFNNYVDGGFVLDDLRQIVRSADGERVSIVWIPEQRADNNLGSRVLKSIEYYKAGLEELIRDSGADIKAIREFRTDLY